MLKWTRLFFSIKVEKHKWMAFCLHCPSNCLKCSCVIIFQKVVWNSCCLHYATCLWRHSPVAASCLKGKENILIHKTDCVRLHKRIPHNEVDLLLDPFYLSSTEAPPSLRDNKRLRAIQIVL